MPVLPRPGPARPRFAVHGVEGAEPQQRGGVSAGGTQGTPPDCSSPQMQRDPLRALPAAGPAGSWLCRAGCPRALLQHPCHPHSPPRKRQGWILLSPPPVERGWGISSLLSVLTERCHMVGGESCCSAGWHGVYSPLKQTHHRLSPSKVCH